MNRKLLFLLILTVIAMSGCIEPSVGISTGPYLFQLMEHSTWWLTLSIAATLLTYVVRAIRWQVLLNPLKSIRMGPLISTNF